MFLVAVLNTLCHAGYMLNSLQCALDRPEPPRGLCWILQLPTWQELLCVHQLMSSHARRVPVEALLLNDAHG